MSALTTCCNCFGNSVTVNPSCGGGTPTKCGKCMALGHIMVGCENSIAPCDTDSTIKIPFDCFCIPCDDPKFTIINRYAIKHATVESIDKTGITIRPKGDAKGGDKVEISFVAVCGEGCDLMSDYGSITLYFKNLCLGKVCGQYEVCNHCNGECEPIKAEVSVDQNDKSIEIA